ncbi:Dynamin 6 isoform 1 [Micractinium conductrix]|uniref:Dynamin 6 isoform 1 n=1 Tax=Micractinium conductrix TaxID=554055 RepID=A0A2P6VRS9_9CHLO|nr:Dynamin 6 isoform 1 [Micractinium conductrix]|eukprot:PSC76777.1 Dynamin 6 isoform 1 [Micractinium conductrix]
MSLAPVPWPLPPPREAGDGSPAEPSSPSERVLNKQGSANSVGQSLVTSELKPLQIVFACRNYSKAFASELKSPEFLAAAAAAVSAASLGAAFAAVDLEAALSAEHAQHVFTAAFGYQSWLVAPEKGVRALVAAALELYRTPMLAAASTARTALLSAADAALPAALPEAEACASFLGPQLHDRARDCIAGWHDSVAAQLQAVLEAEQACPAAAPFAQLRSQILSLLPADPAAAPVAAAAEQAAQPAASTAAGKPVAPALAQGTAKPAEAPMLMGWLDKAARHGLRGGAWQRRWFVLHADLQQLMYMKQPGGLVRDAISLEGATVVEVSTTAGAGDGGKPVLRRRTFEVRGAGGKAALALRASSGAARTAWVAQLRAACAPAPETAALPGLMRGGSAASSEGGEGAEDDGTEAGGMPRRISTQVYPAAAAAGEEEDKKQSVDGMLAELQAELQEGEQGDGDEAAPEAALTAAIAQQSAERKLPAALMQQLATAVRAYVEEAQQRLHGATGRLVSNGMLLEREEPMRQALLLCLLPAGATPARLDF